MNSRKCIGAITALITPFKADGSVDVEALRGLVRFQIDSGIHGIVPCGSTGEAATMNPAEYRLVVQTVVEEAKGAVPIIAGAGSNDTKKAIEFSQIAHECGADALLHVNPYYNKPTPDGLFAHFQAIAQNTPLPIIIYNVPGRTGLNMKAETVIRIAQGIPQVVGIKEASGDINQMADIIRGAPKGFLMLSGDDSMTLPSMALGGVGCISVVSNEIPKEFSQMVSAALKGDWEEAKRLHFEWLDLMQINFIESNPIPVKAALAMMGKIQEVYRLPMCKITDASREVLTQVLKRHGLV